MKCIDRSEEEWVDCNHVVEAGRIGTTVIDAEGKSCLALGTERRAVQLIVAFLLYQPVRLKSLVKVTDWIIAVN